MKIHLISFSEAIQPILQFPSAIDKMKFQMAFEWLLNLQENITTPLSHCISFFMFTGNFSERQYFPQVSPQLIMKFTAAW